MRSLGDKLLIFDQKLKNIWGLWVTGVGHNIRCLWVMSELRKGILRALHSVPLHMGVPESPTLQNKLSMLRKYGALIWTKDAPAIVKDLTMCPHHNGCQVLYML